MHVSQKASISFYKILSILQNENLDSLDNVILEGDPNCLFDPLLHKKGGASTKSKSVISCIDGFKSFKRIRRGGLRMVDLDCMVKSLRLAWLKRFSSGTNGTWKSYLQHVLSSVGGLFFFFNSDYKISDYTIPS